MFTNKNNKFQLDNHRLDSYRLMIWLQDRGLRFGDMTETLARQAVADDPDMVRRDLKLLEGAG